MRKKKLINFEVTEEMRREAKIKAAKLGISISEVLRQMLQEWLEQNGGDDDKHDQR